MTSFLFKVGEVSYYFPQYIDALSIHSEVGFHVTLKLQLVFVCATLIQLQRLVAGK